MTEEQTERLGSQGAMDKLVGRAKEVVGEAVGADALATKGRLQQAEGEAKREAAHHQLEADVQRLRASEVAVEGAQDAAELRTAAALDEAARKAQVERERLEAYSEADAAVAGRERAAELAADAKESTIEARERLAREERAEELETVEALRSEAERAKDNAAELERLQQDVQ